MSVYQDKKSKRWYFNVMIQGQRHHKAIPGAVTKRDAEIYFNAYKTDLLRGKLDLVENIGCKLFKDLVNVYLEYSKANNRSYKCNESKALRFKELWGNKQLKDISPIDIEKYKISRKKEIKVKEKIVNGEVIPAKYISNTTINRDIEVLRKMFNIAIENNWLLKNPCGKVKKLREQNVLERYLTPDEEIRLLNACIGHFEYMKPIIQFALNTGMRKEEILSLTWKCVSLDNKKITLLDTKNGKKRYIPINSEVMNILQQAQKNKTCDYVFVNPLTNTRYADLKNAFPALCKIAQVENFRFHDLRHSAATRMVGAGVDIVMVKDILGHSDIRTTMRYAHAITERSLNAIETLSNYAEKNKKVVEFKINAN